MMPVAIAMVFFLGCQPEIPAASETPLHRVVEIFDEVLAAPHSTVHLCAEITPLETRETCFSMGFEALRSEEPKQNLESSINICAAFRQNSNSECWFRLAERSDNPTYCEKSTSFEQDCRAHLLSRWLFRNPDSVGDWEQMVQRSVHYGIDANGEIGQTILYRHILSSQTNLRSERCDSLPSPEACKRALQGVYLDRLRYAKHKNGDLCHLSTTDELHPQQDPILHATYTEFTETDCTPPPHGSTLSPIGL